MKIGIFIPAYRASTGQHCGDSGKHDSGRCYLCVGVLGADPCGARISCSHDHSRPAQPSGSQST